MVPMDSVGRYRLERRIGAGSFATVWLGHDDDLDVPVAVKVLAENWASNDNVRQRFLAEAKILRRIRDRRLVQVYDIGTLADGRPYFVMDYIDGGSMNDLRKAGVDPVRALRLGAQACRAIEVLHENDIIHRDVTPGNLLLSSDANGETRVLIADLGVAKSMIDAVGATMTAGTPSYMAPEQASGRVPLDRRADVYSLTAVAYALLTGRPPFVVKNIADILGRDPALRPEPIANRLGAPATLDGVMMAGLASDRNRRPPTALLLAEALEAISQQMEAGPRPTAPGETGESTMGAQAAPSMPRTAPPAQPPTQYPATSAPTPSPVTTSSWPPGGHAAADPYASSMVAAPPAAEPAARHGASYYVLLGTAALALFAISMFVTILLLR